MIIVREIEPMQQVTEGLPPAYYQQPANMLENIIILRIQKFVLPFLDWIPEATRYRTDNGKKCLVFHKLAHSMNNIPIGQHRFIVTNSADWKSILKKR